MGTSNGGAAVSASGRLEMHRVGDLKVLEHIQRVPKESRVESMAYTDDTAHDADMIQAVARLRAQHGQLSQAARHHLVNTIQTATAALWRPTAQRVQEASGGQGGSASRANTIAGLIATDHNKKASATPSWIPPSRGPSLTLAGSRGRPDGGPRRGAGR